MKRPTCRASAASHWISLGSDCSLWCVFTQQQKTGVDKRECCLQEIRQTEEKYTDTLESILQVRFWEILSALSHKFDDFVDLILLKRFQTHRCVCAALHEAS